MKKKSPRQELGDFTGSGNLRSVFAGISSGLSEDAIELLINITLRYCEPPRRRRKKTKTT